MALEKMRCFDTFKCDGLCNSFEQAKVRFSAKVWLFARFQSFILRMFLQIKGFYYTRKKKKKRKTIDQNLNIFGCS